MKKKILLAISLLVAIVLIISVSSCSKKTTTTPTSLTANEQRFKTIEANMQSQLDKLNALQAEINKLKSEASWQTYVNGVESKLQKAIDDLALDNTRLKSSLAATLAQQDSSIQLKLTEADKKIAEAIAELKNASVPKYAFVNNMGRRYIEVTVYGAGNYPVVISLYGTGLKTKEIEVDVADDEIAAVTDEQIIGNYTLAPITTPVTTAPVTVTSGAAIPTDPIPHTHSVVIPGVTINGITYNLVFNGTLLVLVVEPDTAWKNGDTFSLDIRDISGSVILATANVGVN